LLVLLEVFLVGEEIELIARIRKAGGIKRMAYRISMRPSCLSNKLRGWSHLRPEERAAIELALQSSAPTPIARLAAA